MKASSLALCLFAVLASCGEAPPRVDRAEPAEPAAESALSNLRSRQKLRFHVEGVAAPIEIPAFEGAFVGVPGIPSFGTNPFEHLDELPGGLPMGAPPIPALSNVADGLSFGLNETIREIAEFECDHRYWVANGSMGTWDGDAKPTCELLEVGLGGGSVTISATGCSDFSCAVEERLCVANVLLEMANETYPTELHVPDRTDFGGPATPGTISVPVQSLRTRAALYEFVLSYMSLYSGTQLALVNLFGALSGPGSDDCDDPSAPGSSTTKAEELTVHALEYYETIMESGVHATELYSALADEEYGHANQAVGMRNASVIRQFAASLVTSGNPFNLVEGPLSEQIPLSESGGAALNLLRTSGIAPQEISRVQSIDAFLGNPSDTSMSAGLTVFPRLMRIWMRTEETTMTAERLRDELGLTKADFEAARQYLRNEFRIFHRSYTAVSIGHEIPGLAPNDQRYAATMFPPAEPNGALHVAPFHDTFQTQFLQMGGIGGMGGMSLGAHMLALFDDVIIRAGRSSATVTVQAELEAASDRIEQTLFTDLSGQVYVYQPAGSESDDPLLGLIIAPVYDEDEIYVTTDPLKFRCAVSGNVDGAACSVTAMDLIPVERDTIDMMTGVYEAISEVSLTSGALTTESAASGAGFPMVEIARSGRAKAFTFTIPRSDVDGAVATAYVLALRPTSDPEEEGEVRPAAFEPLGAATWYPLLPYIFTEFADPEDEAGWVVASTLSPRLDSIAADLVTPSRTDPGRARLSCAGVSYDARIPLEDSLSSDGDAFESSWRYYLSNARNYAEVADRLGEEALAGQLEIDRISESAVAELADICGFTPNLDPLAATLADRAGDPVEILEEFAPTDENAQRIVECLGRSATVPLVSLGSVRLCLFHPKNAEDKLCDPTGGAADECPRVMTGDEMEVCGPNTETRTYVMLGGDDLLGYFAPPAQTPGGGAVNVPQHTAATYRNMRRALETPGVENIPLERYRQLFVDSNVYSPENVRRLARDITWAAHPGGYSTLSVGGQPILSTGSYSGGPGDCSLPEPCGALSAPYSLYCQARDCSDRSVVNALNARMARAATVARWLGQTTLEDFVLPEREHDFPDGRGPLDSPIRSPDPGGRRLGHFAHGTPENDYYCEVSVDPEPAQIWIWTNSLRSTGNPPIFTGTWEHHYCNSQVDGTVDVELRRAIRFMTVDEDHPFGFGDGPSRGTISANYTRAAAFLDGLATRGMALDGIFRSAYNGTTNFATACQGCPKDVNDRHLTFWDGGVENANLDDHMNRASISYYFASNQLLPRQALLDALELIAMAAEGTSAFGGVNATIVTSKDKLKVAIGELRRFADETSALANTMVMQDMPTSVVDALREQSALVTPTPGAGTTAAQAARIRSAMIQLRSIPDDMEDAFDVLANQSEIVENAFERAEAQEKQAWIEHASTVADRLTQCATSTSSADSFIGLFSASSIVALTCANSATQIGLSVAQLATSNTIIDTGRKDALLEFSRVALDVGERLEAMRASLLTQAAEIDAALQELTDERRRGQRALARALFLDSTDTHGVFRSNTTLRRRLNTSQVRYERSRQNAVRWSFMAKRAIEQRFGVRLADMRGSMGALPAPSSWESSLCTMRGMMATDDSSDESAAYIGDYVTLLENFVDAYRTTYPFFEGRDTAVISLRDDVQAVRDACEVSVPNLLAYSTEFARAPSEHARGWSSDGCDVGPDGRPLGSCVQIVPLNGVADTVEPVTPESPSRATLGYPKPHRFTFGPTDVGCSAENPCGWQVGASWGQTVTIEPGHYVVSWYARAGADSDVMLGKLVRVVERIPGFEGEVWETGPTGTSSFEEVEDHNGWTRFWFGFDVIARTDVRVEIAPYVSESMGGNGVPADEAGTTFDIAGLMLERAPSAPSTFIATGATNATELEACEDTDGDVYRRRAWTYDCVKLCNDGYSTSCPENYATKYCYWETQFDITNRAIERGEIFSYSGFARGNFNYRADTISVNFVGSGSRICTDSDVPSTCYSAGFIPYSLEHAGPYNVRNHFGEIYEAPLFVGLIEHARGLAAERYVTNPISGADLSLLSQYEQETFRGRPLAGTYRLRVWHEPGVNFEGIEDVQIILGYRYWTRSP